MTQTVFLIHLQAHCEMRVTATISRLTGVEKPMKVSLNDGSDDWTGTLPAFNSSMFPYPGGKLYPPTSAYFSVSGHYRKYKFKGIICVDNQWNNKTCLPYCYGPANGLHIFI